MVNKLSVTLVQPSSKSVSKIPQTGQFGTQKALGGNSSLILSSYLNLLAIAAQLRTRDQEDHELPSSQGVKSVDYSQQDLVILITS
jgi:hypothetical protein